MSLHRCFSPLTQLPKHSSQPSELHWTLQTLPLIGSTGTWHPNALESKSDDATFHSTGAVCTVSALSDAFIFSVGPVPQCIFRRRRDTCGAGKGDSKCSPSTSGAIPSCRHGHGPQRSTRNAVSTMSRCSDVLQKLRPSPFLPNPPHAMQDTDHGRAPLA